MSEKSFEALQQEIIQKLSDCFNTNRTELLKIEPVVHEWQHKIQKLNQYRDQSHLRNFLSDNLGLSNSSDSQVHETTKEEILTSFERLFNSYLDFVPYENFTKASEILQQIHKEPLDSYESVTSFIKLRTQLSNYLNDYRNEKCQRVHEKLTQAFKTVQAKLTDPTSHGHAALDETELISREVTEALKLYNHVSANTSGDLSAVAVRRYDLSLTRQDLLALKENKDIRSTLVDFFGLYLNERGENRVLFLKHEFAQTLLEGKEVAIENWETERVFWLKEYSAGAIGDIEGSVWKDYSRACVPFLNHDGEWGLVCIDHEHKTARIIEFGSPLEEHKANDLVRKIERYLSGEKSGNEHTVYKVVRDSHKREGDNGRAVLYAMYQFQAGSHEHEGTVENEEKLTDFNKKLFGTLVLIGVNNDGYLKFDELLLAMISQFFEKNKHHFGSKDHIPPSSTDLVVIIPYSSPTGFDRSIYLSEMIGYRASYEEINQFLKDIEDLIAKHKGDRSIFEWIVLAVFLFLIVLIVVLIFGRGSFRLNGTQVYWLVIGLVAVLLVVGGVDNRKQNAKMNTAKAECRMLIENKYSFFKLKGLRWHISPYFPMWIELWKDYLGDGSDNTLLSESRSHLIPSELPQTRLMSQASNWVNQPDYQSLR